MAAPMGTLVAGVWRQVPFPTAGPFAGVLLGVGGITVGVAADYSVDYTASLTCSPAIGNTNLEVVETIGGMPGGPGVVVDGTQSVGELIRAAPFDFTLNGGTIVSMAFADELQLWARLDAGPDLLVTVIAVSLNLQDA
jgi:hypothetical protein